MSRPKGSPNKIGQNQKEFIIELLKDNQDAFKRNFEELATSTKTLDKQQFMGVYHELQKLVVPRPTEVNLKHDDDDFDRLKQLFSQWDDEDGDEHK